MMSTFEPEYGLATDKKRKYGRSRWSFVMGALMAGLAISLALLAFALFSPTINLALSL
jgi:hypothetical protein